MRLNFSLIYLVFIALLFESCARNPVTGKRDFMLISKNQEIAMGQQADPEIVSFFGLYDDQQLQRFIDEKGRKMAAISHREDLNYHFKIVDSPVINAFAVPGGYVYFTRGIMAHFNNEAEFAGVLGHEIGHIAARHSAKQYSKAMMAELGLAVGSVLSEQFAQFSDLARTGVGLLFLKYGRDAERQSDRLGVEYSTKIGYDAHEMANFFNILKQMQPDEGQQIPSFLSTHPHPEERLDNVKALATEWQQKLNLSDKELEVNRDNYLKMIDGIVYGEDPRQGFTKNNVFYHPEMRFLFPYPDDWVLQNTPQQVQINPKNGEALLVLSLVQGNSLSDAASAILERYNLEALDSERTTVNGFETFVIVAEQKLQQQPLRLLIHLIKDQNRIYNFMGVSEYANFNSYYKIFANSLNNFERLTDPEIINIQPDRINIVEAERTTSLANVLKRYNVKENRLKEVALLNGLKLQDPVKEGTLIKIIEK